MNLVINKCFNSFQNNICNYKLNGYKKSESKYISDKLIILKTRYILYNNKKVIILSLDI